jgi:hypothetical protein
MPAFDYKQALKVRDAFRVWEVRYLFLGKSGAILLGFPDTTQDVDLFAAKTPANYTALLGALRDMGFDLTETEISEIERGKDFIQLRKGPFDLDLVFAPDGIENFEAAWERRIEVEGFPVCHLDDIIASKTAARREKDRETLPRLESFRKYWMGKNGK